MQDLLEDCVAVECDDVDAAHLGQNVQANGNDGSIEVAVWCSGEWIAGVALLVQLDGVTDDLHSRGDDFRVLGFIFELAENFCCFCGAVFGKEPS